VAIGNAVILRWRDFPTVVFSLPNAGIAILYGVRFAARIENAQNSDTG
jgi:hypothetical protein